MNTFRIIPFIAQLILVCASFTMYAQNLEWAYKIGSPQWDDTGTRIYADDSAHVYVLGRFHEDVDFDLGPDEFLLSSDNGSSSVFVLKLDSAGGFIWALKIGGYYGAYPTAMAFDHEGNLIIAGSFDDAIDADPGPGTFMLNEVPDQNNYGDSFVLKLNSNGEFIWAKAFGSVASDNVSQVAIDDQNNVYIGGYYMLTMDVDPGDGVNEITSGWNFSGFILKLDSSGSYVWSQSLSSDNTAFFEDIKLDVNGNLCVVGYYSGTIDFDAGAGLVEATSPGQSSSFILNLDPSGAFNWVKEFGGIDGYSGGGKIIFDQQGNMYFTASLNGTIDIDPGVDVLNRTGTNQSFIVKLDEQANLLWARSSEGTSSCFIQAMDLHPDGYLIAVGSFSETADLDMSDGVANFTSNGSADYFMMHMSSTDGSHLWASASGNYYIDAIGHLDVDAEGNVYNIGIFQATVDIDPGPGIYELNAYNNFDCLITKLSACSGIIATEPMTGPASACAGSTSAVFNCEPATGASEIVWTVPEGCSILSGQNSTEINIAMGNSGGQVVATILYSCSPSVADSLEIISQPVPTFTVHPTDISVTAGEDALFTVEVSPSDANLQWYSQIGNFNSQLSDGASTSGTQTDSLTRLNVTTNQNNMNYFCIANFDGCKDTSDVATLTVLPTNISEIDDDEYLVAYPNPAEDLIYLQCSNLSTGKAWRMNDSVGRVVASGKLNGFVTTIDLHDLCDGVYFLQCDGESSESIRIVKR